MAQHVRPSGKRLGVKMNDGQKASPGMVIVRQRGMKVGLGKGVAAGRDHTIYSIEKGSIERVQTQGIVETTKVDMINQTA